jgi:sulfur relay (sulfurtransferase) DsrC/TusE family protein
MESAANRLQKEAKGYLDSLRGKKEQVHEQLSSTEVSTAMTASQMRIAETIDAFYGDAGTKDGVSRSYKQAVEDLDAETIKALDGPYRYAILTRKHLRTIMTFVLQNHRPRTYFSILCLLPRHQRMHQETQSQTARLRLDAIESQAIG